MIVSTSATASRHRRRACPYAAWSQQVGAERGELRVGHAGVAEVALHRAVALAQFGEEEQHRLAPVRRGNGGGSSSAVRWPVAATHALNRADASVLSA